MNFPLHNDLISLPLAAGIAPPELVSYVTNSIFMGALVALGLIWFMSRATKNVQLVPDKKQNFVETIVELLYNQLISIVGPKVAPKAFPLLATFFIFILTSNWMGLVPGVGTIGWAKEDGRGMAQTEAHATQSAHGPAGELGTAAESSPAAAKVESHDAAKSHDEHESKYIGAFSIKGDVYKPLLRPATADMNMTLAMALIFMIFWWMITMSEVGFGGFIKHVFAPKGKFFGVMAVVMMLVFAFVGLIEIVSIAFRPASLGLRLFGNIYAGETLLHTMGNLGPKGAIAHFIMSVIVPLPFYFMELLVGLLQAVVFTLLCAVYIKLSTEHDDHGHEEHAAH